MPLFQTVRPLDAAAFARLFAIELFWRTLLSVLFAVPPFLFCRRAQKRRSAVFSAALGSFLYAALLFAPMLAGFAYHEPVFILLPAPLYATAGFLCLLCVYLRTTRPCKTRRFLSRRRGSVALSLAARAALHFIWYALETLLADHVRSVLFGHSDPAGSPRVTFGTALSVRLSLTAPGF